jgi:hypothetical protein
LRIWIDAQLSPGLAPWIAERFRIETRAVRDFGLRQAKDDAIYGAAREAGVIVMTKDAHGGDITLGVGNSRCAALVKDRSGLLETARRALGARAGFGRGFGVGNRRCSARSISPICPAHIRQMMSGKSESPIRRSAMVRPAESKSAAQATRGEW